MTCTCVSGKGPHYFKYHNFFTCRMLRFQVLFFFLKILRETEGLLKIHILLIIFILLQ